MVKMKPIRLVVVDDHALFRSGLISLLDGAADFKVVGQAANGMEAQEVVKQSNPDVVLLDVNMPVMGGVDTVKALKKRGEYCILMLTISKSDDDLFGAISAGADGYLLKNASPEELFKAIRHVYEGMAVLSPDVTRQVLRVVGTDHNSMAERGLSSRELEVLKCLAQGKTTAQISTELYITDNTVKTHVRHILEKLEAANRAEAVSKAVQLGVIGQET
jgi:DNA-binding NarL/FixJ family response regulator